MKQVQGLLAGGIALLASVTVSHAEEQKLTGAGSSFAAPIYSQWADAYKKQTTLQVNYQSIGSNAGVNQILGKTVDFGATDTPLAEDKLQSAHLIQFPTVIGGVVPIINIAGIKAGQLHLSGELLADIYLGKITYWDDPAIVKLNAGLTLPHSPISVVRRADGSGTSYVFTEYLAKANAQWQQKVGIGNAVQWPVGFGAKGNEGMAVFVMRLPDSIGYVEYSYAKQNHLAYVDLQNAAGQVVEPTTQSFQAAAKGIDWAKSFSQSLVNGKDPQAWPITTTTFVVFYPQAGNANGIVSFFNWAFQQGDEIAQQLDYVPFPAEVKKLIRQQWQKNVSKKPA